MSRCIVNFASRFPGYRMGQERLKSSLKAVGWTGGIMTWLDEYPPGAPDHDDSAYSFKIYAVKAALDAGYTSIIWMDSYTWFIRSPDRLFDEIEREGHWLVHADTRLFKWISDAGLKLLGVTRDQMQEMDVLQLGGVFGLDLTNERSLTFYNRVLELERAGLFEKFYFNDGPHRAAAQMGLGHRDVAVISEDERCWGHKADEVAYSWAAHELGMKLTMVGKWWAGRSPGTEADPDVLAVSEGM